MAEKMDYDLQEDVSSAFFVATVNVAYRNGMDKKSLKNLIQYRDLSDEEFELVYANYKSESVEKQKNKEVYLKKFDVKLKGFEKDYEIGDLKYNDKQMLNSLIEGLLSLEDLEEHSRRIRKKEILDEGNIEDLRKVSFIISKQRADISRIQADLNIARKGRESEKDLNVLNYIEKLKKEASTFYEKKMNYVFCPKCKQLLFTGWFLYPNENNAVKLTCGRTFADDETDEITKVCNHTFTVTSEVLVASKNKNIEDIIT